VTETTTSAMMTTNAVASTSVNPDCECCMSLLRGLVKHARTT
jgi:hypothetical protein